MNTDKKKQELDQKPKDKKPNDHAGFYFSSMIKISDPTTGKILVQKRCD